MNNEKMTKLPPVEVGYIINPDLPVIPFSLDVNNAGCAASHAHPRGQFIYASKGTMRVVTSKDIWIVPDFQAVWVPPYVEHEVYFPGMVTIRNLFIDQVFTHGLPQECVVVEVSDLLRELIVRIASESEYSQDDITYKIMLVILDEIKRSKPTDIRLPLASDKRVLRVMDELIKFPGDRRSLVQWAHLTGASSRTLSRLFVSETGLTFNDWRKRVQLQHAISRLGDGDDVTSISFDLGYQSVSAFIQMFKQSMGISPGRYSKQ